MSTFIGYSNYQNTVINSIADRVSTAEDTITLNKSIYDTKVAQIDNKNSNQDVRLTAAETKITNIENNIQVQVNQILTSEAQEVFDSIMTDINNVESTLSNQIATKVASEFQVIRDTEQDALISSKVDKTVYDTKMTEIDNKHNSLSTTNGKWENRFLAIEEFINAYLKAFAVVINGTNYEYKAAIQQLPGISKSPFFTIISKTAIDNTDWKLTLQFNDYSYNAFIGSISCQIGSQTYTLSKSDIDSTTYRADMILTNTRSGTSFVGNFPLNIHYLNINNQIAFTSTISADAFINLP